MKSSLALLIFLALAASASGSSLNILANVFKSMADKLKPPSMADLYTATPAEKLELEDCYFNRRWNRTHPSRWTAHEWLCWRTATNQRVRTGAEAGRAYVRAVAYRTEWSCTLPKIALEDRTQAESCYESVFVQRRPAPTCEDYLKKIDNPITARDHRRSELHACIDKPLNRNTTKCQQVYSLYPVDLGEVQQRKLCKDDK